MRFTTWLIGLSVPAFAFAVQAQEVPAPPSDAPVAQPALPSAAPPPPADGSLTPQSGVSDPAVPSAAPPPDAGPPPPSGAQVVMAAPSPVVQQVPPPPADYPRCTKTMKDECANPGGK
ncbi:MAG TPA: hypothetical protein VFF84_02950 [Sphingobium sp.]|nr:hypothetical protein [Sphingobium sp.]